MSTKSDRDSARAYLARMAQASAFSRETREAIEMVLAATAEPSEGELVDWLPLGELRCGAIFETRDGIHAVKSEYWYDNGGAPECILLGSGEYAHFPNGAAELVREVHIAGARREGLR